jgi:acyl dehydratase
MSSFYEDIKVGDSYDIGSHTFTADEIVTFAKRFDPQRFHLSEEEARKSHFGKLAASGWQTACVWMRLMVDYRKRHDEAMRARGQKIASIGPAPGFKNLKWLKPVYVGDTITYRSEVIDMRTSNSRPTQGLMTIRSSGVNQNGEMVITFDSITFVERRNS